MGRRLGERREDHRTATLRFHGGSSGTGHACSRPPRRPAVVAQCLHRPRRRPRRHGHGRRHPHRQDLVARHQPRVVPHPVLQHPVRRPGAADRPHLDRAAGVGRRLRPRALRHQPAIVDPGRPGRRPTAGGHRGVVLHPPPRDARARRPRGPRAVGRRPHAVRPGPGAPRPRPAPAARPGAAHRAGGGRLARRRRVRPPGRGPPRLGGGHRGPVRPRRRASQRERVRGQQLARTDERHGDHGPGAAEAATATADRSGPPTARATDPRSRPSDRVPRAPPRRRGAPTPTGGGRSPSRSPERGPRR